MTLSNLKKTVVTTVTYKKTALRFLQHKAVVEALDGLPPVKIHCSVLAEEAVKAAVKDYYDKNGIEYDPEQFKENSCDHCHV